MESRFWDSRTYSLIPQRVPAISLLKPADTNWPASSILMEAFQWQTSLCFAWVSRHSPGISPRVTFVRASWPSDVSLQISKLSFLSRAGKAVGCRCTLYVPPARPCDGLRSSFCSIINVNSAINSTNQSVLIMLKDCLWGANCYFSTRGSYG